MNNKFINIRLFILKFIVKKILSNSSFGHILTEKHMCIRICSLSVENEYITANASRSKRSNTENRIGERISKPRLPLSPYWSVTTPKLKLTPIGSCMFKEQNQNVSQKNRYRPLSF